MPWATCPVNTTLNITEPECKSPTTYFWYHTTLEASPSMDESGGLKWWIVLCLFTAWLIVFLIVMKGIQSSGNVRFSYSFLLIYCNKLWFSFLFKPWFESDILLRKFKRFSISFHHSGGILYISIPVHCIDYIFHTWDNVERCWSWFSAHVHTRSNEITAANGLAGRSNSSVLLIWFSVWLVDCVWKLQHSEK